jgi:hypothetical protein
MDSRYVVLLTHALLKHEMMRSSVSVTVFVLQSEGVGREIDGEGGGSEGVSEGGKRRERMLVVRWEEGEHTFFLESATRRPIPCSRRTRHPSLLLTLLTPTPGLPRPAMRLLANAEAPSP